MTDIETELHAAGAAVHDAVGDRPRPLASRVRAIHLRRRRRRHAGVAVAGTTIAVAAGVGVARWSSPDDTIARSSSSVTTTTVALSEPTTSLPTTTAEGAPAVDPAGLDDVIRTLLPGPVGGEAPRFVRLWNRIEHGAETQAVLSEQWYGPDGTAVATVTPLVGDTAAGWADLARVPETASTIREQRPEADFGYPERGLDPATIAAALAAPDDPGVATPPVFTSVGTGGGVDRSVLAPEATTVREAARLLPTVMDVAHREAIVDALRALDGVTVESSVDEIGRPGDRLTVPLAITTAADGVIGRLDAVFVIGVDGAPLQIEWRLGDGRLPDGATVFRDVTVVLAAGEVAAIPG